MKISLRSLMALALSLPTVMSSVDAAPGAPTPPAAAPAASFSAGGAPAAELGRAHTRALTPGFTPGGLLSARREDGDDVRVNDVLGDHLTPCTTQSETSLVAVGDNVVVGFNDSGEGCISLDSYTGFAYSTNAGQTFTDGGRIAPPDGGFSGGDPSLVADRQGRIYLATLENASGMAPLPRVGVLSGRSYLGVRRSDDGGKTWSAPVDGTAGLDGTHDKELLAIDNTGGEHDGNLYLAWTDFTGGQGRGVIRFSRSTNRGVSFSEPIKLSRTDSEYAMGAYPAVGPNGEIYVTWQTQLTTSPAIYFTVSLDGGETFSVPRKIRTIRAPGTSLTCGRQGMNGEIRMLAWPVMAVDHTPITDPENPPPTRGAIYIAYASKDGADHGNVFLMRSFDGGMTWDPPSPSLGYRVNDVTTNDQFMVAIANKDNGEVALLWHDRRNDANNRNIEIFAARSLDAGKTWSPNLKVSDVAFEGVGNNLQRDPGVASCYMGDYVQMIPYRNGYAAAWGDNRERFPLADQGARSDPNVYFDRFSF